MIEGVILGDFNPRSVIAAVQGYRFIVISSSLTGEASGFYIA